MPGLNLDFCTLLLVIILLSLLIAVAARRTAPPEPTSDTSAPFTVLSLTQAFEPSSAVLWQTQLPALALVASSGRNGLATTELQPIYRSLLRQYPELYEGTSFGAWVRFLVEAGLISVFGTTVTITEEGRLLLHYLSRQQLTGRARGRINSR